MENASKALVMAGGVLISIIIISMLILMANSLTSYQDSLLHDYDTDNMAAFNSQFTAYERDDVRGNELLTLINKVLDYHERIHNQKRSRRD